MAKAIYPCEALHHRERGRTESVKRCGFEMFMLCASCTRFVDVKSVASQHLHVPLYTGYCIEQDARVLQTKWEALM